MLALQEINSHQSVPLGAAVAVPWAAECAEEVNRTIEACSSEMVSGPDILGVCMPGMNLPSSELTTRSCSCASLHIF